MPVEVMWLVCNGLRHVCPLCTPRIHHDKMILMTTPATPTTSQKAARRTNIKTFRLFRDQISYIENENGDCSSFFMRFLLDAWIDGKIPFEIKKEFFALRKDIRQRAEDNRIKQIVKDGLAEEEREGNAEI